MKFVKNDFSFLIYSFKMKYLKTYKLFENNSTTLALNSEYDWNRINNTIETLHISYTTNTLHKLPKSLKRLYCSFVELTELPTLPDNLEVLACNDNKLTRLPELPKTLISLYCNNNLLTELPTLPKTLKYFEIHNNSLEKLPEGITEKLLLKINNKNWIKENALKWIINKPIDYNILKDYLSEEDKKELNKIHPELLSQDQFGMFGLKQQII